jgi:K(+)-stimulated pyrophosphate-energized sodium pump
MLWTILSMVVSVGALAVAVWFYRYVKALPCDNPEMNRIGGLIREGAFPFMKREYQDAGHLLRRGGRC